MSDWSDYGAGVYDGTDTGEGEYLTGTDPYGNATGTDPTVYTSPISSGSWWEDLAKGLGFKNGSQLAGLAGALGGGLSSLLNLSGSGQKIGYTGGIPKYTASREQIAAAYDPNRRPGSAGQKYFTDVQYKPVTAPVAATDPVNMAHDTSGAANSSSVNPGDMTATGAQGGLAALKHGRYLIGDSDGMADKVPASIDGTQEARLSHGEFVIPADVVSHLGNGNSSAGAQRLYDMMDRIRKARTGTKKQGKQINPNKFMPS